MNESEWLVSTDPRPMLRFLQGMTSNGDPLSGDLDRTPSDRKHCLFSCACCRRIWHLLTDERSRRIVEATEAVVDQFITQNQLIAIAESAEMVAEQFYGEVMDAATAEIAVSTDPDAATWVHGAHECAIDAASPALAAAKVSNPVEVID